MKKILGLIAAIFIAISISGCQGAITGHEYDLKKIEKGIVIAGKLADATAGIVENGKGIYLSDTVQRMLDDSTKAKIAEVYRTGKDYYELRNEIKDLLKEEIGTAITVSEDENSSFISIAGGE